MELDTKQFGGALAKAVADHARLSDEAAEAKVAETAAEEALKVAREEDIADAVGVRFGKREPREQTREAEAEIVLRAASFDAEVARRSVLVALDAVAAEATKETDREKLTARRDEVAQAAVAALDALDSLLDDLQTTKAHLKWLDKPIAGERLAGVRGYDVWVTKEAFLKPNGEPGEARDLTAAVREALQGPRAERSPASEAGVPVGFTLSGPWGVAPPTPAYQRKMAEREQRISVADGAEQLLAEQLLEAQEAQQTLGASKS